MNATPRILILSASVGAGHLRAAQAVELAFRELAPNAFVQNSDVLELTNAAFRRVYGKAYFGLVNRAPHLLGFFYDAMDKPRGPHSVRDRLRLEVERLNLGRLERLLTDGRWDMVVNTHFLPAEIVANMRKRGHADLRQVTVTTDFETRRLWVNQPCERYFTATEEGARYLQSHGVPKDATRAVGIPIHPLFGEPRDRSACRQSLGIGDDRPVILQLAGGFGIGPVEELSRALLTLERPSDIVIVCGKNARLREKLAAELPESRHRVQVIGFTDRIDEYMAAADLVVSKPGGLTTSEVLARGAAMAVVSPIPGQESRNSDYLLENGAAVKINAGATLSYKIGELLADEGRLRSMKANALRLGRPRAAFEIARQVLEMV